MIIYARRFRALRRTSLAAWYRWRTRGRRCESCHVRYRAAIEHDPCIRGIPGAWVACCGHGKTETDDDGNIYTTCYVGFDGMTLYGHAAHAAMEMLGGHPPAIPPEVPHGFICPGNVLARRWNGAL